MGELAPPSHTEGHVPHPVGMWVMLNLKFPEMKINER